MHISELILALALSGIILFFALLFDFWAFVTLAAMFSLLLLMLWPFFVLSPLFLSFVPILLAICLFMIVCLPSYYPRG
jgi:hypothetical protein